MTGGDQDDLDDHILVWFNTSIGCPLHCNVMVVLLVSFWLIIRLSIIYCKYFPVFVFLNFIHWLYQCDGCSKGYSMRGTWLGQS